MRKTGALLAITLTLAACGGRQANPVLVDQVGDNRKNCASLESEIRFTEAEIQRLLPQTDKTGKNVGLGVAGAFLIVPLFFMDLTESEKIEINAHRQRYNRLNLIAAEKNCPFTQVTQEEPAKPKTN